MALDFSKIEAGVAPTKRPGPGGPKVDYTPLIEAAAKQFIAAGGQVDGEGKTVKEPDNWDDAYVAFRMNSTASDVARRIRHGEMDKVAPGQFMATSAAIPDTNERMIYVRWASPEDRVKIAQQIEDRAARAAKSKTVPAPTEEVAEEAPAEEAPAE